MNDSGMDRDAHSLTYPSSISSAALLNPVRGQRWGCSSVGRASDWHAADAGSIPQCGKGFFSFQSQLSVLTFLRCPYTPVCNHIR